MFDTPRYAVARRAGEDHRFVMRVFGEGDVIHTSHGAYQRHGDDWYGSPGNSVTIEAVYDTKAEADGHDTGA